MKKSLSAAVFAALATFSASTLAVEPLTIGASAPLSGAQAYFGSSWLNGLQLYIDQANAAGGVGGRKIALQRLDDKADPREGTLIAQKFCDERGVVTAVAHMNSGVTIPTMDIYNGCGMPQLTISTNPKVTQLGFKHVFQGAPNDSVQGELSASYAYGTLNARKAAVVNDKQAFGQGVSQAFTARFKSLGGAIASTSSVNPTDVDFSSVLATLKQQAPDVVYFGGTMPQLALFVKQMRSAGMKATFMAPDGAYTPQFYELSSGAAANAYVTFQALPYDASPELRDFAAKYQAKFGAAPGPQAVYGWVSGQTVVNAMKSAKSLDRAGILAAMRLSNFDSLLGKVAFDPAGALKGGGLFMFQVEGKNFKLVSK
ncbi:branched-chain amino acid ABC transporter substrate-binding protein [Paraburkholderia bonniea]|uniref:branched-chain amino acid ABC transporter substrate-binding protein n=1 Tax=Paraburkholderia bonniea TaxID=2152891 RepID=UPI001292805E|nr:branched-chain amino acid ABC transporter substrate-binding protein [Paraburkholderia bonniea]WJF89632.1 branched-chain amino acid ABC transporter substrate-binding protein [Paraburkholderia bonniea]WJF92946.1 branched-chain amino acid ABC transporter substrate-binding protein [Paraburkholderia bonniea]